MKFELEQAFTSRTLPIPLALALVNLVNMHPPPAELVESNFYLISQAILVSLGSLIKSLKFKLSEKESVIDSVHTLISNILKVCPTMKEYFTNSEKLVNYAKILLNSVGSSFSKQTKIRFFQIITLFGHKSPVFSTEVAEELFKFCIQVGISTAEATKIFNLRPFLSKTESFNFTQRMSGVDLVDLLFFHGSAMANANLEPQFFSRLRYNTVELPESSRKRLLDSLSSLILTLSSQNSMTDKRLALIWKAIKVIESIYSTDLVGSDKYSILSYIVSQADSEAFFQSMFKFGLKTKFASKYVIRFTAFCLKRKIDYASVILPKISHGDPSVNLPFNYQFLQLASRAFLSYFEEALKKMDFEQIQAHSRDIVTQALNKLFLLDSQINFSQGVDKFWSNNKLTLKIKKLDAKCQWEAMKGIPFIFRFDYRLALLNDYMRNFVYSMANEETNELKVHRECMFDEVFALYLDKQLNPYGKWRITMVDKFDNVEDGIDQGGLTKEFFFKLSEDAFKLESKIFVESTDGRLMPNPDSQLVSAVHLEIFEFLGFIVGNALLRDIKIYPAFSGFFLNTILGKENGIAEMKTLDPELATSLIKLLDYEGDVENDFCLNFSSTEHIAGKAVDVELIQGGANIPVTNANKFLFVTKVCEYKMKLRVKDQCEAFKAGLLKVYDSEALTLFTADELRQMICGFDKRIDLFDWQTYTRYVGVGDDQTSVIRDFWAILQEFENDELEKLLFFVTSLKQPPLKVQA